MSSVRVKIYKLKGKVFPDMMTGAFLFMSDRSCDSQPLVLHPGYFLFKMCTCLFVLYYIIYYDGLNLANLK